MIHWIETFSDHAEVLVYDWSQVGDPEIVVEDVERVDFDKYTVYDTQQSDWRRQDKWDWNSSRHTWWTALNQFTFFFL